MRPLILCAAGALALSACQQPAPPAEPEAGAPATEAETAAGSEAAATTPDGDKGGNGAMAPGEGAGGGNGAPAAAAPPEGGMMSGPSQATRDAAKEKAEATNLHPRS